MAPVRPVVVRDPYALVLIILVLSSRNNHLWVCVLNLQQRGNFAQHGFFVGNIVRNLNVDFLVPFQRDKIDLFLI